MAAHATGPTFGPVPLDFRAGSLYRRPTRGRGPRVARAMTYLWGRWPYPKVVTEGRASSGPLAEGVCRMPRGVAACGVPEQGQAARSFLGASVF